MLAAMVIGTSEIRNRRVLHRPLAQPRTSAMGNFIALQSLIVPFSLDAAMRARRANHY